MKHFSPGLSDSIASVIVDPAQCPHCDSSSRIVGGLCVGCMLQAGLEPDEDCAPETLVSALAEITLPDKNWRLGNYEILEEIGRGGMGVIYRARQRHSRRIVAVKRVLGYHADSRETLARFRREAQAAASLDHPNILPIYEVSESEDGLPFFSMKFAPGGSLQEVGPALGNDPRQCVALVAKIARAVQYAHSKGILHRDLKPGNILLDGRGEPLVSDFGLAKWLDTTSDLTRTLTIFGTPGYIAPEQASGPAAQLKPAADVYSLGAILFDLLAGRPPFLGSHALSVIRQAAETTAPKLRSLSKVADRDLETICSRCLEREPSARYRSAHDLVEDLERWLEDRPIIARPVSPPVKAWRWCRRNPSLGAVMAICTLLIAGMVVRQVQNRRLEANNRERQRAMHTVVVLPILDLDHAHFDGALTTVIAESLQSELSEIGVARVTSLSESELTEFDAANDMQSAARIARARSVITGTVRKVGVGIRLSVRLFDGNRGNLLFQRTHDAIPQTAASATAALGAKEIYSILSIDDWSSLEPAKTDPALVDSDSRDFITSGRDFQNHRTVAGLDRALECFRKAIALSPASPLARALFAMAAVGRTKIDSVPNLLNEAETCVRYALGLDPNYGEAHRALGNVLWAKGDLAQSESELVRAIEIDGIQSGSAISIGGLKRSLGRPDEALKWYLLAKRMRVQPAGLDNMIGDCWADLVDDTRAEAAYRRIVQFRPELPDGWMGICRLRLLERDFPGAREVCEEHLARYPDHSLSNQLVAEVAFFGGDYSRAEKLYEQLAKAEPDGGAAGYGGVTYVSVLGALKQRTGKEMAVQTSLSTALEQEKNILRLNPTNSDRLYSLAALEALLGQTEPALLDLEEAFNNGWIDYRSTALDPRFARIANNPRFKAILNKAEARLAALRNQMLKEMNGQKKGNK
jgi:tetratricopeptide (TPR) repeat protein/TolB-like protein/tRNA A-37 threonylcarbamoyl transferase component Bud32